MTLKMPGSRALTTELVAIAWVGFDQPATLGRREYGGVACACLDKLYGKCIKRAVLRPVKPPPMMQTSASSSPLSSGHC